MYGKVWGRLSSAKLLQDNRYTDLLLKTLYGHTNEDTFHHRSQAIAKWSQNPRESDYRFKRESEQEIDEIDGQPFLYCITALHLFIFLEIL